MVESVAWFAAFVVLVVVETFTLEFSSLSLAFGCLLAATVAWLGLPLTTQALVACVGSGAGLMLIAPALRKRILPWDTRTGNDLIVGSEAEVIEAIQPPAMGKVKLHGVIWQAESNKMLSEGTRVYITELNGTRLTVVDRQELIPGEKSNHDNPLIESKIEES